MSRPRLALALLALVATCLSGCDDESDGDVGVDTQTDSGRDVVSDTSSDTSPDTSDAADVSDASDASADDTDARGDATRDATDGSDGGDTSSPTFSLTSSAFTDGASIPEKYSCNGQGISPPLSWSGAPSGAKSYVLLVDDPDAGNYQHWAVYDMPAGRTSLPEDVPQMAQYMNFRQATNMRGSVGYFPPCPPPVDNAHTYRFRLWALDVSSLNLSGGNTATYSEVQNEAQKHRIAETILKGEYNAGN